jgi:methanogenic corrinoid protein MtbC1
MGRVRKEEVIYMDRESFTSDFTNALLQFDKAEADALVEGLKEADDQQYFLDYTLVQALQLIGQGWESGQYALSQVYLSGRICEGILDRILPEKINTKTPVPIAIATLADHHLLGKRIVRSFFKAAGIDILDLGHGMDAPALFKMVQEADIKILLISVLMYNSALHIKELRLLLDAERPGTKLLVGGAPFYFDTALATNVGADAMAYHPAQGIEIVRAWIGGV